MGAREARCGTRFDFVDLENPQVRRPPVGFEERTVIRTEMSRQALPTNGGVEHTADIGTRRAAALHAEADEATREPGHDHERDTTFLSMSSPNACEMMRAMRRQPKWGLRDFSSTIMWTSASSGAFAGFLGHGRDENSRPPLAFSAMGCGVKYWRSAPIAQEEQHVTTNVARGLLPRFFRNRAAFADDGSTGSLEECAFPNTLGRPGSPRRVELCRWNATRTTR
jgi:hypothetical protein